MDVIGELKFLGKFTKKIFFGRGGSGGGGSGWGDQGGCERRIEVFVKIQKKKKMRGGEGSGWGGGVRVDVIAELKFLGKFTKKNWWGWGGLGRGGGGGSGWCGGVRVDVNEEFKFL